MPGEDDIKQEIVNLVKSYPEMISSLKVRFFSDIQLEKLQKIMGIIENWNEIHSNKNMDLMKRTFRCKGLEERLTVSVDLDYSGEVLEFAFDCVNGG